MQPQVVFFVQAEAQQVLDAIAPHTEKNVSWMHREHALEEPAPKVGSGVGHVGCRTVGSIASHN